MMHQGLDIYVQAIITVANYVIIRACIMDLEMPYFLIWSLRVKRLVHHAVHYINHTCLVSPFYEIPIILFLIMKFISLNGYIVHMRAAPTMPD